jgi:hypothetical protein
LCFGCVAAFTGGVFSFWFGYKALIHPKNKKKKNIELEANASHGITKTKKQRKYQIRNY